MGPGVTGEGWHCHCPGSAGSVNISLASCLDPSPSQCSYMDSRLAPLSQSCCPASRCLCSKLQAPLTCSCDSTFSRAAVTSSAVLCPVPQALFPQIHMGLPCQPKYQIRSSKWDSHTPLPVVPAWFPST